MKTQQSPPTKDKVYRHTLATKLPAHPNCGGQRAWKKNRRDKQILECTKCKCDRH